MRSYLVLSLCLLAPLGWFSSASAAEFLSGGEVDIAADETWEGDVYIFAQSATVEGTIKGDLVVYAQKLHVTGNVEGGIIAAGQQVMLEGKIGRSSRIACQAAKVASGTIIDGDLVAACYSLETEKRSEIQGDLIYAGYQAMLRGTIDDDVWGAANRTEVYGEIGRELSISTEGKKDKGPPPQAMAWQDLNLVRIPTVAAGLTIREGASIGGKVIYRAPDEVEIEEGASVTGPIEWIEPKRPERDPRHDKTHFFLDQLKRFIMLLLMGMLMVGVCPRTTGGTVEQIVERPVVSFLAGIVAVPVSIVMLSLITALIVAIPLAFGWLTFDGLAVAGSFIAVFGLILYVGSLGYFFVFGAAAVTSITIGRVVFSNQPITSRMRLMLALAFGLVFYVVLTCVPYLSAGVVVTAILFAFGGIFLWLVRGLFATTPNKTK